MESKEIITLVIAVAGLSLGVFNTWKAHARDKVRLRLELYWDYVNEELSLFGMRVINLSSFPVTIQEMGIRSERLQALNLPSSLTDTNFEPVKLEPRTSTSFRFHPNFHRERGFATAQFAYAQTVCGTTIIDRTNFWRFQKEVATGKYGKPFLN